MERYVELGDIPHEKFNVGWTPRDHNWKASIGYIYELVCENTTVYIGSTDSAERREEEHRENIKEGTAPVYEYLRKHGGKFELRVIKGELSGRPRTARS